MAEQGSEEDKKKKKTESKEEKGKTYTYDPDSAAIRPGGASGGGSTGPEKKEK